MSHSISLSSVNKKLLLFFVFVTAFAAYVSNPKHKIQDSTVMITNLAGNSGGSGSIIYSRNGISQILTNSHVCEVVVKGGLVTTTKGVTQTVVHYVQSELHDLCLITVGSEIGKPTRLAGRMPASYDSARISGHPRLLPNIITEGHFSERRMVSVLTGFRDCTEEEKQHPVLGFFCAAVGGLPVVKTYETVVVSALIQAGSSGSGVYTEDGEIGAVVFAGSGDIGYAMTVPYEYVDLFLNHELKTLKVRSPNMSLDFDSILRERQVNDSNIRKKKFKDLCESATDAEHIKFCNTLTVN